jgi:hypothetical protein
MRSSKGIRHQSDSFVLLIRIIQFFTPKVEAPIIEDFVHESSRQLGVALRLADDLKPIEFSDQISSLSV